MLRQVHLSGMIRADRRERIARGVAAAGLNLRVSVPVPDHSASDAAGMAIHRDKGRTFWNCRLGTGVNAIHPRAPTETWELRPERSGTGEPGVRSAAT